MQFYQRIFIREDEMLLEKSILFMHFLYIILQTVKIGNSFQISIKIAMKLNNICIYKLQFQ